MPFPYFKYFIILSLFTGIWERFNKISLTNHLKTKAEHAFVSKDYITSSNLYDSLIHHYQINDQSIRLNLAHSYFKLENRKKAIEQYKILTNSEDSAITSIAFQQLGLLSAMKGKPDEAIAYFKKALKINDKNEKARFNLELMIKLKQLEADQSNKSSKSGSQGKEKGGGKKSETGSGKQEGTYNQIAENGNLNGNKGSQQQNGGLQGENNSGEQTQGESGDGSEENDIELKKDQRGNKEDESIRIRRLAELKISQERARLILEEMKNEEVQYLQQLKIYQENKEYNGKPDW
jgi:tetratricopeptide (TPR) repeat protein